MIFPYFSNLFLLFYFPKKLLSLFPHTSSHLTHAQSTHGPSSRAHGLALHSRSIPPERTVSSPEHEGQNSLFPSPLVSVKSLSVQSGMSVTRSLSDGIDDPLNFSVAYTACQTFIIACMSKTQSNMGGHAPQPETLPPRHEHVRG